MHQLADRVDVLTASDAAAAFRLMGANSSVDLILLDLLLPDADGFDVLVRLRDRAPEVPIVVVSALEEENAVRRAMSAGALGYIPKSTPPLLLLRAIRQVLAGEVYDPLSEQPRRNEAPCANSACPLSPRQTDVLRLICEGKSNKYIAAELNLSEKNVKGYVTAIFKSLDVVNRTQAVLSAQILGLFLQKRG